MRDETNTENDERPVNWPDKVRLSLMFLSRLPIADAKHRPVRLSSVMEAFPFAGLIIGLLGGLACVLASGLGLPPAVNATLTLAFMALLTGGLHEDGLADLADGLGGGQGPKRKLAVMKDSRIGAYGVLALIFAVALKIGALGAVIESGPGTTATLALFAAIGAWSRTLCVALMATTPNARGEGVAAEAGRPDRKVNRIALAGGAAIGSLTLWPVLGFWTMLAVFASSVAAFWLVRALALRHIGGHTGDVAGTVQIVTEIVMLIVIAVAIGI